MIICVIIRLILSTALLVGIYGETGKWTTVSLGLIMVSVEIINKNFKKIK